MTAHTPILLDPFVIDLRTLLRGYLQNLPILLAHELKISVVKTRLAVAHSIDAMILGLYHSHETPKPNTTLQQAFGKIITLYSLKKIHAQAVTHDFFASYEDSTIAKLSQITQLTLQQSSVVLGHVAALAKDYLGRILVFTQLSEREYREWLTLQSLFVSADAATWDLPNIPKSQQSIRNDYEQKIGKVVSHRFDTSTIALPNHRWLISLAQAIDAHYRPILTLGKIPTLPATPKQSSNPNHHIKPALKNHLSKKHLLIVLACLMVVVISVLIWYLKKPQPQPATAQTNAPIPQDVAIVRVDGDGNDNHNTGNEHKNSNNHAADNANNSNPKPQNQNNQKAQPTK